MGLTHCDTNATFEVEKLDKTRSKLVKPKKPLKLILNPLSYTGYFFLGIISLGNSLIFVKKVNIFWKIFLDKHFSSSNFQYLSKLCSRFSVKQRGLNGAAKCPCLSVDILKQGRGMSRFSDFTIFPALQNSRENSAKTNCQNFTLLSQNFSDQVF